ncbi:hypothetical protein KOM00_18315 [Geomonas sp. Red69]|uniref:Uncharacterized protein n=1 Tax=Geomonas diazotrophica TaxID=2843197 RepID=A0ABX8JLA9_9BACT|nr:MULTISPECIES: hypothetical protein [Geomonas]MBU5638686.1 hypothetical protein [Geomonas diazotrophica]QWV98282.1 hypothetical protein KP005_03060 [Geomonas nitrogeniifigens]
MKIKEKITAPAPPGAVKTVGSFLLAFSLLVFSQQTANATAINGDSTTILRMREGVFGDHLFPLYEYLNISASDAAGPGAISLEIGGWGRVDLGDRSFEHRTEGDIQYGYLSYRANRSNFTVSAGRQWVVEGVGTERIDGLYLRSDLIAGLTAAAYVGNPAVTQPDFDGGDLIYGGRLAHSVPKYYSVGLSALRTEVSGDGIREEEGIDLWLHPISMVDITGRSTYNSLSNGWMEHAYTASVTPTEALRFSASLQNVHYDDYFYQVTTSALSLTNGIIVPGEEMWNVGGSVGYSATKNIALSAEYNHYEYDLAGGADYYGVNGTFSTTTGLAAGASFHRMDGSNDRLRYNQYRAWATQKLGPADLTLDFFDVDFDGSIGGRENTFSLAAAAGYDFSRNLRVAADVDYIRSADFDNELRGLIKVSYAFGVGKEGK